MSRLPTHRAPVSPGEILLDEFITPMGLTQREVAEAIGVPFQRLNAVVRGRRALTPSTALRLARYFGTSPELWVTLQSRVELYHTRESERDALDAIRPLAA